MPIARYSRGCFHFSSRSPTQLWPIRATSGTGLRAVKMQCAHHIHFTVTYTSPHTSNICFAHERDASDSSSTCQLSYITTPSILRYTLSVCDEPPQVQK